MTGGAPDEGRKSPKSRLSIRPTARGWQALTIGVIALVAARLIGTTQLHQLAYALILIPVAALLLGMITTRGLTFSRGIPGGMRITAGAPAAIDLQLRSSSRFGTSVVEVSDMIPDEREFEFSPLDAHGEARSQIPVTFARRGVYQLGPAEVSVVDPFEMLNFTRRFDEKTEVVVYPEVHELRAFPIRGGDSSSGGRGTIGHRGDEFAGLREYRRGDDRRHIHWKSLARTGELYVKEFSLHAPKRYTVALDLRRGGLRSLDGPVEDSVSAAASILTHLRNEGMPFRILCTDKESENTEFGTDEASYWGAMRVLASVRADGAVDLPDAVLDDRSSLGEGVVLVSRNLDEDLPERVRKLKSSGLSAVVALVASHTYHGYHGRGSRERASERETAFLRHAEKLDHAGASVCVVRHPEGVAGLSGVEVRGAV